MISRVVLLLCLDTAMLLFVCVLECLALTDLDVHVWLGFALCPLVLAHVVMQWQWFVTQFQRIRTTRAYRVRINALLNLGLLFMMSAVLLSGILSSGQAASVIGEIIGRARIWREIHGWLNFIVVMLVGLHLALNWDWMIAALRRRRPERPGLVGAPSGGATVASARRSLKFANLIGRGLVVLLVASLAAGTVYFVMRMTMSSEESERIQNERAAAAAVVAPSPGPPVPPPRPVELPHGVEQLLVTSSVLALTVVIGRYVFRLHL